MARSRTPLRVSSGGTCKSLRAWASPRACVLPSLPFGIGLTLSTGLSMMLLRSQLQASKQEALGMAKDITVAIEECFATTAGSMLPRRRAACGRYPLRHLADSTCIRTV